MPRVWSNADRSEIIFPKRPMAEIANMSNKKAQVHASSVESMVELGVYWRSCASLCPYRILRLDRTHAHAIRG